MSRSRTSIRATSKILAILLEAFRKIWIIIILCAATTTKNQKKIQLPRPLTNRWLSNSIRVTHNSVHKSQGEALTMRILIAIITILRNLHSAFMLMEIIIMLITNVNLKLLNDLLKIKERFQQLLAWLHKFQDKRKWHLNSNTSSQDHNNTSPSTNHHSTLNNRSNMLFHTTLLSNQDNLNHNITNTILIIRLIQE